MERILSTTETKQLISHLESGGLCDDPSLASVFDTAKNWEEVLHLSSYCICKAMLSLKREQGGSGISVTDLYEKLEEIYMQVEVFDSNYLEMLLKERRNKGWELENDLIKAQRKLNEREYSHLRH